MNLLLANFAIPRLPSQSRKSFMPPHTSFIVPIERNLAPAARHAQMGPSVRSASTTTAHLTSIATRVLDCSSRNGLQCGSYPQYRLVHPHEVAEERD